MQHKLKIGTTVFLFFAVLVIFTYNFLYQPTLAESVLPAFFAVLSIISALVAATWIKGSRSEKINAAIMTVVFELIILAAFLAISIFIWIFFLSDHSYR